MYYLLTVSCAKGINVQENETPTERKRKSNEREIKTTTKRTIR